MTEPKALKDMTWEEAEPIYRAFHEGNVLEQVCDINGWKKPQFTEVLHRDRTYRIKPTKPSINWDHVNKEWNYLCVCPVSGGVLFKSRPEIGTGNYWVPEDGFDLSADNFASFDPGTCDWKDSLVIRPGHEQD